MANKFSRNVLKITQIYNGFKEGCLIVDKSYQRKKVWGDKDNVRLIETILLDLIIPEIFMWDYDTDPDTGKTITHIVDGQQRINAIFDFIAGKYRLQKKYLLDDRIKETYGDKFFGDLDDEAKKAVWSYEMSIVNLDKQFSIDDVRTMFYRLNLTDYSLNEQEKRNSWDSAFGKASTELVEFQFWSDYKLFSVMDIRRMKDIEYCSTIILLAREGVIDQTKGDRLDEVYREFAEEYLEWAYDLDKIEKAMNLIELLTKGKTNSFLNKKIQMYTMFSVMFDFIEDGIDITEDMTNIMDCFMVAYSLFKNEYDLTMDAPEEQCVVELLKRYKLASSEGVNKLGNRMIRFEIIKKLLKRDAEINISAFENVILRMQSF